MKFIKIYKATGGCHGNKPPYENGIESVTIELHEPMPGNRKTNKADPDGLNEMARRYDLDAALLFDTLVAALPGGTLSRLTGYLLANYAGHLIVPFGWKAREIVIRTESYLGDGDGQ